MIINFNIQKQNYGGAHYANILFFTECPYIALELKLIFPCGTERVANLKKFTRKRFKT